MKRVALMGPATAAPVPVKSNAARSPRTVTVTRTGTGRSSWPSSSTQSSPA